MRCYTCGNRMECIDDISNEAWGIQEIFKCKKCGSHAITSHNRDNFIKEVCWKADYQWEN